MFSSWPVWALVAFGANSFPYLRAGDVVEAEIDRLGRQRHVVGQA